MAFLTRKKDFFDTSHHFLRKKQAFPLLLKKTVDFLTKLYVYSSHGHQQCSKFLKKG